MPTIADLERAFERLESQTPDAGPTITAVRTRTSRRAPWWAGRTTPLLAAAAAVVVAVVSVVVVAGRDAEDRSRPAGPGTAAATSASAAPSTPSASTTPTRTTALDVPARLPFDVAVPGLSVSALSVTPQEQQVVLRNATRNQYSVHLLAPGLRPKTPKNPTQPVTVNGAAGWYEPIGGAITTATLAWPVGPDQWALVQGIGEFSGSDDPQIIAAQLNIAHATTFGDGVGPAVTVPFGFASLPTGLAVVATDQQSGAVVEAGLDLADAQSAGAPVLQLRRSANLADEFGTRESLTVAGRPATWGPAADETLSSLVVHLDDGTMLDILVTAAGAGRYSRDAVVAMAEQADLSPVMDEPDSWIPLDVAFP